MAANDDLVNALVSHQVDLMRIEADVRNKVTAFLLQLAQDLNQSVVGADIGVEDGTPTQLQARLRNLLQETNDTISTSYDNMRGKLTNELVDLGDYSQIAAVSAINDVFTFEIATTALTKKDLEVLASKVLIEGSPAKAWWAKQEADLVMRFTSQMRLGIARGESIGQLVQRVRGKWVGDWQETEIDGKNVRVRQFSGGVMQVSTNEATALVRTAVQSYSNQVLHQTYEENDDVIQGITEIATLDTRTTPFCRHIDGGAWDWDGNPLPRSRVKEQYPGPPPYHWMCRTVESPLTYSWDDLIKRNKGNEKLLGKLQDIEPETRASMDGQVPASLNYNDWLKNQSEERQKKVLGPVRFEMWKNGKMTMSDFVDQTGNPISVEDLKKEGF